MADDGVGFGGGEEGGIGNRLIEVLARQLEGELRIVRNNGTIVTVDFPRSPFVMPPAPPDGGAGGDYLPSPSRRGSPRHGAATAAAPPAMPAAGDRGWL
ncbi:MAG TPA: hypothetical protein VF194_12435 [Ferrovibrio sp.]|uniref:hypothetical protein n=1 Tax=Ferrovibrio sp. TaxID=1917215 RepID=UPI002ED43E6A